MLSPIIEEALNNQIKVDERKGMLVLQYQIIVN